MRADERQLTMTGLVLALRENDEPHLIKVTFIRSKNVLVTLAEGPPA